MRPPKAKHYRGSLQGMLPRNLNTYFEMEQQREKGNRREKHLWYTSVRVGTVTNRQKHRITRNWKALREHHKAGMKFLH